MCNDSECNLVRNPKSGFSTQVILDIFTPRKKFLQLTLLLSTMKICSWKTQQHQGLQELERNVENDIRKVLTLNSVLHVPTIRKNLFSAALLVQNGFKFVLFNDKALTSKNEMFIGKCYLNEGLFKLNVMAVDRY